MKLRFAVVWLLCLSAILSSYQMLVAQGSALMQLREVSTHLPNSLTIMNVALQPGFEDLKTLAMLRSVRGARIVSVFCTSGESGESDAMNLYPASLAAVRREEAYKAGSVLEGDTRFLNFEDPGGCASEEEVWEHWSRDSLAASLVRLILEVKPDILLISDDPRVERASVFREAVVSAVLKAVEAVAPGSKPGGLPAGVPHEPWNVARVYAEVKRGGIALDYSGIKGSLASLALERAKEASGCYASLAHQRARWRDRAAPRYERLRGTFPKSGKVQMLDQGLETMLGKSFDRIQTALARLSSRLILASESSAKLRSSRTRLLKGVVSLIDSVDIRLAQPVRPSARQRKFLLSWKRSLEELRNLLLGLRVHFSIDETVLCPRQLSHLTIDSVMGPALKGTVEILFPPVEEGWIIDEVRQRTFPLRMGEPYRLLSPERLDFHLPPDLFGLQRSTPRYNFTFFLLHRAATREESFVYRAAVPMLFAPRHTLEVLPPIVKANEGEELVVRFTNNTRDGVADRIHISSEFVEAEGKFFRTSSKGSSFTDTLRLHWKKSLPDTSIIVPISIGSVPVMHVAARSFPIESRVRDSIGIVTAFPSGTTVRALRNIRLNVTFVSPGSIESQPAGRILVLDERCLSLLSVDGKARSGIRSLAERGGHVVILRQEEDDWNMSPVIQGVRLERTHEFGANAGVIMNEGNRLFRAPNAIDSSLWASWLFFRAYHRIDLPKDGSIEVIASDAATGSPLIVTKKTGEGRITYVDLNFSHQMMNLHSGAMRFFANIVSHKE